MSFISHNPYLQEARKHYPSLDNSQLHTRLEQAEAAFHQNKQLSIDARAQALLQVAQRLEENITQWAPILTQEMGKPITQARAELEKCVWLCRYYAKEAPGFLQPKRLSSDAQFTEVVHEPLGVVLAIMPWNFPFWQVFRCAVPALLAGNTVLLKHASNVPECAETIATLFEDCGLPTHSFQNLFLEEEQVETVLQYPRVVGVALTGSDRAGRAVAALAGKHLKRSVLELGGSDAFVVLQDADLEAAAKAAAQSRLHNAGQTCISAKRFIVEAPVADAFLALFREEMQGYVPNNPMDEATKLGSMARPDLVENLNRQVRESVALGASILLDGGQIEDSNLFRPMILGNLKKGMPAYSEELFGPVASFLRAKDASDALALANDTRYGLGAALWTKNADIAYTFARQLEAGAVVVNRIVRSDPRVPFGGVKDSGYGRELGLEGILEFVNTKSISMDISM